MGALISYYTGMLLVGALSQQFKVAIGDHCDTDKYEVMAQEAYGPRCKKITSIMLVVCLVGFVVSYIIFVRATILQLYALSWDAPTAAWDKLQQQQEQYHDDAEQVKELIPFIILQLAKTDKLPSPIDNQIFWASLYAVSTMFAHDYPLPQFVILLPLSIPRQVSALRFSSLMGFLCSVYLVLVVLFLFWFDKDVVPDISENIAKTVPFKITPSGILNSMPLVIFSYMYQPNIPMIYRELQRKSYKRMDKVVLRGSSGAVFLYCIVGIFGYWTFPETGLEEKNILKAPYKDNVFISIATLGLLFAIIAAAPLCILPAKDGLEELMYDNKRTLSKKQNFIATLCMVIAAYVLAILPLSIGDILTILGATINPLIGFTFPIVFYLKLVPNIPTYKKIIAHIVNVFMIIMGLLSLLQFILEKIDDGNNPSGDDSPDAIMFLGKTLRLL